MPKYRIHMRNGQSFIVTADNVDDAWDQARRIVAKKIKDGGGHLRGSRPADHIGGIESDV